MIYLPPSPWFFDKTLYQIAKPIYLGRIHFTLKMKDWKIQLNYFKMQCALLFIHNGGFSNVYVRQLHKRTSNNVRLYSWVTLAFIVNIE